MLGIVEDTKTIRIETLEKQSKVSIEKWVADWNDEDESVEIVSQTEIWIGDVDYRPVKWKCPNCRRWNYQLTFMDETGAAAVCNYCNSDNEF